MTMLAGHFAVFNEWTTISSLREGRFLERIAPGGVHRSNREGPNGGLFGHGQCPTGGGKPNRTVQALREDSRGGYYEVDLYDQTTYIKEILPGLESGQFGSSFRFQARREE